MQQNIMRQNPSPPHHQTPEASHSVKDALDLSIDLSLLNCAAIPFGKNWVFFKDTEDYEIGSRCKVGLDSYIVVSFVEALLNKPRLMCSLLSCPMELICPAFYIFQGIWRCGVTNRSKCKLLPYHIIYLLIFHCFPYSLENMFKLKEINILHC